jgi:hypothetical protein
MRGQLQPIDAQSIHPSGCGALHLLWAHARQEPPPLLSHSPPHTHTRLELLHIKMQPAPPKSPSIWSAQRRKLQQPHQLL